MKVVDKYNVLDGLKLFHSWFSEVHLRPQIYTNTDLSKGYIYHNKKRDHLI